MSFFDTVGSQLGNPRGVFGRLLGRALVRGNARTNGWAVSLLDPSPGDAVLEIGCGPGFALAKIADRVVYGRAVGVDRSPEMVAQARARNLAAVQAGRIDVREADVASLPFRDGTFDRALGVHVVYFWPDPGAAAAEILRALRPGGVLVLAVAPPDAMKRFPYTRRGFAFYDDAALRSLLEGAGFVDVRVESLDGARGALPARAAVAKKPLSPSRRPP